MAVRRSARLPPLVGRPPRGGTRSSLHRRHAAPTRSSPSLVGVEPARRLSVMGHARCGTWSARPRRRAPRAKTRAGHVGCRLRVRRHPGRGYWWCRRARPDRFPHRERLTWRGGHPSALRGVAERVRHRRGRRQRGKFGVSRICAAATRSPVGPASAPTATSPISTPWTSMPPRARRASSLPTPFRTRRRQVHTAPIAVAPAACCGHHLVPKPMGRQPRHRDPGFLSLGPRPGPLPPRGGTPGIRSSDIVRSPAHGPQVQAVDINWRRWQATARISPCCSRLFCCSSEE